MKANINFKNAEEFQELLERAATLSKQLQETLQQMNDFELDIEVNKTILSKSERAFLVAANQLKSEHIGTRFNDSLVEKLINELGNKLEKATHSF